jgi:hypothetical protein
MPHKGDRDQMVTRPPRQVGSIIRAKALEAGVPYGDYISAILCEYVGLNNPLQVTQIQEELPMPRSA